MTLYAGQTLTVLFTLQNPMTGEAQDGDSLPRAALYLDGELQQPLTPAWVTTGLYKVTGTLPMARAGAAIAVRVSATVNGVAGLGIVYQDVVGATPAGSGAFPYSYTLTTEADGLPIVGADVWLTTDAGGSQAVAIGVTNARGQVTFYVDPGTYYLWRQLPGWQFDNPAVVVVEGA